MKNNKGFSLILIVLIIVAVLVLGGGTYYFLANKTPKSVACTQEAKVCPDGSSVGRTGPNCEFAECPEVVKEEIVDCKNDLSCFIEESKNCNPSKVINTITTDIFGVKQITTSFLEIKGMELDKCILYMRTEKIDLTFPSGTDQEIVKQQKELYQKLEGRDGNCKFKTNDLTAMLRRWETDNLSSDDFEIAECSGKMFETSL